MDKARKCITIKSLSFNNGLLSILISLLGIVLFVLFYIMAAIKYPGGSWMLPNQDGFSFWHNYLCDLLDIYAINGEINTARFYAITALGFLCIGLFYLWLNLPGLFEVKNFNQKIMKLSGLLSLLLILFLAIGNHDEVVRIAGVFGVIAFITCAVELFKAHHKKLFLLGVLCILVFLFNYFIYETGFFIKMLPVIQKITFLLFICWFICLNIALYRKQMLSIKNVY